MGVAPLGDVQPAPMQGMSPGSPDEASGDTSEGVPTRNPGRGAGAVRPSIVFFVVIYGLDWVATVPPTIALCRDVFGSNGAMVFGWVFAAHQIGAALAAFGAGYVRAQTGTYTAAWVAAAALCAVAAVVSFGIRRGTTGQQGPGAPEVGPKVPVGTEAP
jgi:hypothetical protein